MERTEDKEQTIVGEAMTATSDEAEKGKKKKWPFSLISVINIDKSKSDVFRQDYKNRKDSKSHQTYPKIAKMEEVPTTVVVTAADKEKSNEDVLAAVATNEEERKPEEKTKPTLTTAETVQQ